MPNAGTARCAPTFQNNQSEKTFGNRYNQNFSEPELGNKKKGIAKPRLAMKGHFAASEEDSISITYTFAGLRVTGKPGFAIASRFFSEVSTWQFAVSYRRRPGREAGGARNFRGSDSGGAARPLGTQALTWVPQP